MITDGKERQESACGPLELDQTQEPRLELAKQAWGEGERKSVGGPGLLTTRARTWEGRDPCPVRSQAVAGTLLGDRMP